MNARVRPIYLVPVGFSRGILLPTMYSDVRIGVRHLEPIYIGFAVISALGLKGLAQWARGGFASALTAGLLTLWMIISVGIHHPDCLAYFNAFAGKAPENIIVDSNYDWAHDIKFLVKRSRELEGSGVSRWSRWTAWETWEKTFIMPTIWKRGTAYPRSNS